MSLRWCRGPGGGARPPARLIPWLLEVGQGPHCTAGHCWALLGSGGSPLASPGFSSSSPTLVSFTLLREQAQLTWSPLTEDGLFLPCCLQILAHHQPGPWEYPTSARQHLLSSLGSTNPSILKSRGLCQAPSDATCSIPCLLGVGSSVPKEEAST